MHMDTVHCLIAYPSCKEICWSAGVHSGKSILGSQVLKLPKPALNGVILCFVDVDCPPWFTVIAC